MPLAEAPTADSSTGTAAPMEIPITRGRAMSKVMAPVPARAWRMPTAAEALWRMQVKAMPTQMPMKGLENLVRMPMKVSLSFSGSTAPLMTDIPNISTAKPKRISPRWFLNRFLENIRKKMPTRAATQVRVSVENRANQPEPASIWDRQMTQPVMLVPKMAPSTM